MLIIYCDVCNLRILPKDLESGGALQVEANKYFCGKCAPAAKRAPTGPIPILPATVMIPPNRPSGEIRQSKSTVRVPRPSERASGAMPAANSSAARRAILGSEPPKPKNLMLPIIAGSVGAAIFAIGIFVATSNRSDALSQAAMSDTVKTPPVPDTKPLQSQGSQITKQSAEKPAGDDVRQLPSWMRSGAETKLDPKPDSAAKVPTGAGAEAPQTLSPDPRKINPPAESVKVVGDETIWLDDGMPAGAFPEGSNKSDSWKWVLQPEPVFSGTYAHTFNGDTAGYKQHYFSVCTQPLKPAPADILFVYAYLDPKNPPKTVVLQFKIKGSFEHRAYWGQDNIPWGQNFSPSRLPMGDLPKTGEWVRLEVPAGQIGMEENGQIEGCSFDTVGGVAYWDKMGFKIAPKTVALKEPAKKDPPPPPKTNDTAKIVPPPQTFAVATNAPSNSVVLQSKDFKGGSDTNASSGAEPRPAKTIFGKRTARGKLTASFELASGEFSGGMLKVTTCRHNAAACAIAFTINGKEIYNGKDKSRSDGKQWGEEEYDIGPGILKPGQNELVILNMEDTNLENAEPWYMINSVEIRAAKHADSGFPPIVSDEQKARMEAYDRALEALAKKDSDVVARLESVLKSIKPPPAANVFAANETKDSVVELPLLGGVERALELHTTALQNFTKRPPSDPIPVEKLKTTGKIERVEGSKVFVKAGGIDVQIELANIPQQLFYKALAIDESKPAGQADKAAWLLGLGQLEEALQVLKKIKAENRPPWYAGFDEYFALQRATKFEAKLNQVQQFLLHGKPDTAQIMLNSLKKDYADLLEANKDRIAALAKKLEAGGIKK